MRDLLLVAIVLWGLSKVFRKPHVGIYLWTWFSLMNPHRLTWGFAYSLPFAQIIGAATLIGLLTGSKEPKLKVWAPETAILLILVIWVCITTFFAVNQAGALQELNRFIKIQIFIFLTILLISDRAKLQGFIWVMALSIGFYGIKGGIFTIATAGGARVWGPSGSFIGGNNEIALAMLMTIPLMRYLQLNTDNKYLRWGLLGAMLLTAFSVLGSQSRGAFVGIIMIGIFFWWKSPHKIGSSIIVGIVAAIILLFMPQTWWDRMNTIENYEQDQSAMGRINAWWVAFNTANDSITGGGANMFIPSMFAKYAPIPWDVHDVHSIYFEMLGEQGWIGLILFLSLILLTWLRCNKIAKIAKNKPELKWAKDLALMLQVSLIAYATAGAFLGLSYFDYFYDLIAAALITWRVSLAELEQKRLKTSTSTSTTPINTAKSHTPSIVMHGN